MYKCRQTAHYCSGFWAGNKYMGKGQDILGLNHDWFSSYVCLPHFASLISRITTDFKKNHPYSRELQVFKSLLPVILILRQKSNFDSALMLSSTTEGNGPAEFTLWVAVTSVISIPQELSHRSRLTAVLRCVEVCARIDIAKLKMLEKNEKKKRYMG